MKRCALLLFLPPLIFLFACGCSMRSGGKAAISNVTASVEGLDSRTLESYAEPAGKNNQSGNPAGAETAGKADTAAVASAPDQVPPEADTSIVLRGRLTLNVQFDTSMDTIREEYRDILVRFARVMKNHPGLKVTIEGHTDNVGNAESNLELSRKRAESVKSFLVSEGIDASRIATMGYGQSRPVADNTSEQGRERNRRVEAEVEYEKTPFLKKAK